jgi:hypothetical protein
MLGAGVSELCSVMGNMVSKVVVRARCECVTDKSGEVKSQGHL